MRSVWFHIFFHILFGSETFVCLYNICMWVCGKHCKVGKPNSDAFLSHFISTETFSNPPVRSTNFLFHPTVLLFIIISGCGHGNRLTELWRSYINYIIFVNKISRNYSRVHLLSTLSSFHRLSFMTRWISVYFKCVLFWLSMHTHFSLSKKLISKFYIIITVGRLHSKY